MVAFAGYLLIIIILFSEYRIALTISKMAATLSDVPPFVVVMYILVVGSSVLQAATLCPRSCECVDRTVNCQGRGFQSVPELPKSGPLYLTDLSRNNITVINLQDFNELLSRVINLSQNNIKVIIPLTEAQQAGFSLHTEDTLNISHNMLTSFPAEFVNKATFVDVVDLSFNMITSLSAAIVDGNADLERVILSHNRLSYVHPQAFINTQHLQEVDLRYNYLTTLPANFELTVNDLLLDGNPWHCDCHQRWMFEKSIITESPSPPVCGGPSLVAGRSLLSLQPDDLVCTPHYNNGSLLVQSNLGERVELICPAEGDPPITEVMWSFRGQHPSYTIASKPEKPLIIESVTEATVGRYRCTVWNKGGNLTLSISLSVWRSDVPTVSPELVSTTDDQYVQVLRNSSKVPLPVASDFKVPILGIFALTSLLFVMIFVVLGLLAYTCNLRKRLKHKRSVAREGMFFWQSSFPQPDPYTNTESATLPVDNGYMHLLRNVRPLYQDRTGYRQTDDNRCRGLMLHPSDYASCTRKRMRPVVPPVAPTHEPQGMPMAYGYDPRHVYDTLGARCLSSCSESSGSQASVAI